MSMERRVSWLPGTYGQVAAENFGEKASSAGRTEPPCFHSTPGLVPADFPPGSCPAPPGEMSLWSPWGQELSSVHSVGKCWGEVSQIGCLSCKPSDHKRSWTLHNCLPPCKIGTVTLTAFICLNKCYDNKICIFLILQLSLAVSQRPIICLGEMGTPGQIRYNLLSKDSWIFSVFHYCPGLW